MGKITTRGFTLPEVLITTAMTITPTGDLSHCRAGHGFIKCKVGNAAPTLIATTKASERSGAAARIEIH
jgi:hypothetical protein